MTPKPPPNQAIVGKAGWGVSGVDHGRLLAQLAFLQVYEMAFFLNRRTFNDSTWKVCGPSWSASLCLLPQGRTAA